MARIVALLVGAIVIDRHRALALAHRLLQGGHDAILRLLHHAQAIHHQVDRVGLVAVEAHAGLKLPNLAIDAGIEVALLGQRLEQLAVVTLTPLHHGCHQGNLASGEALLNQLRNAVVGVVHHSFARDG